VNAVPLPVLFIVIPVNADAIGVLAGVYVGPITVNSFFEFPAPASSGSVP